MYEYLSYGMKLNSKNLRLVYANDIVIFEDTKNEVVKSQRNKENKESSHIMSPVIDENKT